jgi:hypothetical protein
LASNQTKAHTRVGIFCALRVGPLHHQTINISQKVTLITTLITTLIMAEQQVQENLYITTTTVTHREHHT